MNSLFLLNETYTNGFLPEILDFITVASIITGIFVIVSKNPIVSVLYLIALFLSISSFLMIIGLNFVGISYLLVYVGAVSILFLFILMLINVRISELLSDTSKSIPLAIIISIAFNYTVYQILPYAILAIYFIYLDVFNPILRDVINLHHELYHGVKIYDAEILYVTSKLWDGYLAETTHITSIGNIMYTSYPIWLIITSIILLLAMVGAIVITIKQKN